MRHNHFMCCYDLETADKNPHKAQIIQIAACMIELNQLKIVSRFSSWIRPDFDASGCTHQTIQWHADQRGITFEEMMALLNDAPELRVVWADWCNWVDTYNKSKPGSLTDFMAPIRGGFNNTNFDDVIMDRYCKEHGPLYKESPRLFNRLLNFDSFFFMWFLFFNNTDLKNMKLATILEYMGIDAEELEKSHDAIFDAEKTARLIMRLFKLQFYLTAFNNETGKRRLDMRDAFKKD